MPETEGRWTRTVEQVGGSLSTYRRFVYRFESKSGYVAVMRPHTMVGQSSKWPRYTAECWGPDGEPRIHPFEHMDGNRFVMHLRLPDAKQRVEIWIRALERLT